EAEQSGVSIQRKILSGEAACNSLIERAERRLALYCVGYSRRCALCRKNHGTTALRLSMTNHF
ncbi:MAG: hypothetical protein ORN98_05305, partial [Alphaproteobacteria bacterium]|nr:hypothetical protein [Alphaproteobacteria bacterium]